jgi:hypothetical protein
MIFSSLQSSTPAAWHAWLVFIAWVASAGAIIIFIGLVMEKVFNKPMYRNMVDFKKSKSRKSFGESLVIWGVGFEIISAIVLAVRGEIENKRLDPRNQPISDISATAILLINPPDFIVLTNWDARWIARMTLGINDTPKPQTINLSSPQHFDTLDADNFVKDESSFVLGPGSNITIATPVGIRFRSFNFRALRGWSVPAKSIDDVNLLRLDLNFLPHGSEIAGGSIELIVNNNIQKQFIVFPQTDTNSEDGSPGHPYTVVATNFDKTVFDRLMGKK